MICQARMYLPRNDIALPDPELCHRKTCPTALDLVVQNMSYFITCILTSMHTYIHTFILAYINRYVHTYTSTYVHTDTCAPVPTYIATTNKHTAPWWSPSKTAAPKECAEKNGVTSETMTSILTANCQSTCFSFQIAFLHMLPLHCVEIWEV